MKVFKVGTDTYRIPDNMVAQFEADLKKYGYLEDTPQPQLTTPKTSALAEQVKTLDPYAQVLQMQPKPLVESNQPLGGLSYTADSYVKEQARLKGENDALESPLVNSKIPLLTEPIANMWQTVHNDLGYFAKRIFQSSDDLQYSRAYRDAYENVVKQRTGQDMLEKFKAGDYKGGVIQSLHQSLAQMPFSWSFLLLKANPYAGGVALGLNTLGQAGNKLRQLDNRKDIQINDGIKFVNALATGGLEVATETIGDMLEWTATKGFVMAGGKAVLKKQLGQQIAKSLLSKYATMGLKNLAFENIEEQVNTILGRVLDVATGVEPDYQNLGKDMLDTAIQTSITTGWNNVFFGMLGGGNVVRFDKMKSQVKYIAKESTDKYNEYKSKGMTDEEIAVKDNASKVIYDKSTQLNTAIDTAKKGNLQEAYTQLKTLQTELSNINKTELANPKTKVMELYVDHLLDNMLNAQQENKTIPIVPTAQPTVQPTIPTEQPTPQQTEADIIKAEQEKNIAELEEQAKTQTATKQQHSIIKKTQRQYDLPDADYRAMIKDVSGGRTETSTELTQNEADILIDRLKEYKPTPDTTQTATPPQTQQMEAEQVKTEPVVEKAQTPKVKAESTRRPMSDKEMFEEYKRLVKEDEINPLENGDKRASQFIFDNKEQWNAYIEKNKAPEKKKSKAEIRNDEITDKQNKAFRDMMDKAKRQEKILATEMEQFSYTPKDYVKTGEYYEYKPQEATNAKETGTRPQAGSEQKAPEVVKEKERLIRVRDAEQGGKREVKSGLTESRKIYKLKSDASAKNLSDEKLMTQLEIIVDELNKAKEKGYKYFSYTSQSDKKKSTQEIDVYINLAKNSISRIKEKLNPVKENEEKETYRGIDLRNINTPINTTDPFDDGQFRIAREEIRDGIRKYYPEFIKRRPLQINDRNGNIKAILSNDTVNNKRWRVTTFFEGKPSGHTTHDTYEQAVDEAYAQMELREDVAPPQILSWAKEAGDRIEHKYELRLRPPSFGTHPTGGLLRIEEPKKFKHGTLIYDRMLTQEQIKKYELEPIGYDIIKTKDSEVKHSTLTKALASQGKSIKSVAIGFVKILRKAGLLDKVVYSKDTAEVTLKGGQKVEVNLINGNMLVVEDGVVQARLAGAIKYNKTSNMLALIDISKYWNAGNKTMFHEAGHFIFDLLLDDKQKQTLLNEFKDEETIMDKWAEYMSERSTFAGKVRAIFAQLKQRFMEFIGQAVSPQYAKETLAVFKQMEQGKLGKVKQSKATDKKYKLLSDAEKYLDKQDGTPEQKAEVKKVVRKASKRLYEFSKIMKNNPTTPHFIKALRIRARTRMKTLYKQPFFKQLTPSQVQKYLGVDDINQASLEALIDFNRKYDPTHFEAMTDVGLLTVIRDRFDVLQKYAKENNTPIETLIYSLIKANEIGMREIDPAKPGLVSWLENSAMKLIDTLGSVGTNAVSEGVKGEDKYNEITEPAMEMLYKVMHIKNQIKSVEALKFVHLAVISALEDRENAVKVIDNYLADKFTTQEAVDKHVKYANDMYNLAKDFFDHFEKYINEFNSKLNRTDKDRIGVLPNYFSHLFRVKNLEDEQKNIQNFLSNVITLGTDTSFVHTRENLTAKGTEEVFKQDVSSVMQSYLFGMAKRLAYYDFAKSIYTAIQELNPALKQRNGTRRLMDWAKRVMGEASDRPDSWLTLMRGTLYYQVLGLNVRSTTNNFLQRTLARTYVSDKAYKKALKSVSIVKGELKGELPTQVKLLYDKLQREFFVNNIMLQLKNKLLLEQIKSGRHKKAYSALVKASEKSQWLASMPFFTAERGNWGVGFMSGLYEYIYSNPQYQKMLDSGMSENEAIDKLLSNPQFYDKAYVKAMLINSQVNPNMSKVFSPIVYKQGLAKIAMFTRYIVNQTENMAKTFFYGSRSEWNPIVRNALTNGMFDDSKSADMVKVLNLFVENLSEKNIAKTIKEAKDSGVKYNQEDYRALKDVGVIVRSLRNDLMQEMNNDKRFKAGSKNYRIRAFRMMGKYELAIFLTNMFFYALRALTRQFAGLKESRKEIDVWKDIVKPSLQNTNIANAFGGFGHIFNPTEVLATKNGQWYRLVDTALNITPVGFANNLLREYTDTSAGYLVKQAYKEITGK